MNYMALKKNLDVTIHEAFLEEILRGNWLPGQALNLDELAERYGERIASRLLSPALCDVLGFQGKDLRLLPR